MHLAHQVHQVHQAHQAHQAHQELLVSECRECPFSTNIRVFRRQIVHLNIYEGAPPVASAPSSGRDGLLAQIQAG